LIESFAVFGGAFVMRPLGGLLMGYIGDMYGRKLALEVSIFLMAVPTFAMGCLPTYAQVGYVSTCLLIFVRMLQGLSVGGQLMTSLVFTVEQHPPSQWGYYGSLVMATANFGTLLGGIVGYVLRATLTEDQLMTWGWRVPFLAGILVSVCGIYLRLYGEETHAPEDDNAKPRENPIVVSFRPEYRRALLSASLVPGLWTGGFYIGFVWMAIYMSKLLEEPVPNAFAVNSGSLFVVCVFFPFAGWLSDVYGRRFVMYCGGATLVVGAPALFYAMTLGSALKAFAAQSLYGMTMALWGAPMCAWLVEAFPPAARLTAVSIGYNLAQALIGGSCPSIATFLVDDYGPIAPGFYLSFVALLAMLGLFLAPKAYHKVHQRAKQAALLSLQDGHGDGTDSSASQSQGYVGASISGLEMQTRNKNPHENDAIMFGRSASSSNDDPSQYIIT
jgi:MHS family proline/betaine transporter-like MFS transporter